MIATGSACDNPLFDSTYPVNRHFIWRPRRDIISAQLPPLLKSWLDTPDSLTARVKASCRDCFSLRVLSEGWHRPYVDEARRLQVSPQQDAWVRVITLMCGNVPWVFARSVMPRRSLRGRRGRLRALGSRPLGTVLFTGREVERGEMEIRRLSPADALVRGGPVDPGASRLWARRSPLLIAGEPILVTEVFLPELDYGVAYRKGSD
jgi:chorismate--pyruvate lyase